MPRFVFLLVAVLATSACVSQPQRLLPAPELVEPYDPFEPYNRRALAGNRIFDDLYIKPFADLYNLVLPKPAQRSASNFTSNLLAPSWILNEILQLDFEDAGHSSVRFVINSTLGIAGLFDPATGLGYEARPEDLGQTLGNWGVPQGPYFIAPVVGPTNARGVLGSLARIGLTPDTQILVPPELEYRVAFVSQRTAEKRIEGAATLERVFNEPDGYILLRSLYLQEQAAALHEDGDPYENLPDFDF